MSTLSELTALLSPWGEAPPDRASAPMDQPDGVDLLVWAGVLVLLIAGSSLAGADAPAAADASELVAASAPVAPI